MHVPCAQVVGPVHPIPPHWPYKAAPPEEEDDDDALELLEVLTLLLLDEAFTDEVDEAFVDDAVLDALELELEVELSLDEEEAEPLHVNGLGPGIV